MGSKFLELHRFQILANNKLYQYIFSISLYAYNIAYIVDSMTKYDLLYTILIWKACDPVCSFGWKGEIIYYAIIHT